MINAEFLDMNFKERLLSLRKKKGLTQQELADLIDVHVIQVHRYETGTTQPTFEVIRKLAVALNISADELIFDKNERGPDEELKLQFEAVSKFPPEDKKTVKEVLDGLILKHEAKRWATSYKT